MLRADGLRRDQSFASPASATATLTTSDVTTILKNITFPEQPRGTLKEFGWQGVTVTGTTAALG